MREILRWLQGAGVAALVALYEVLATAQPSGHIALRAVLLAIAVRVLGYIVAKLPVSAAGVLVVLGLAFAQACTPASGAPAPPREVTFALVAAGDTARLVGSWPSVRGATGYLVTVTASATNGAWTGLPAGLAQAGRTVTVVAISSAADSGTFVLCVRAANPADTSAAGCSAARTWRRKLVPPVPVIDSLVALEVFPPTVVTVVGASSQLCAVFRFASGHVALRTDDGPTCGASYIVRYTALERAVSPSEQAWVDCTHPGALGDPGCPVGSGGIRPPGPARAGRA
jgi:hypothetical protein